MPSRPITPSPVSLFSISTVIGAWPEELRRSSGNCTNCITWRTACDSGDEPLNPVQGLVCEAVERSGRHIQSLEEIDGAGRLSSHNQRGGAN